MLTRQLYQVGPATPTGFGLAAISWQELAAWASVAHQRLTTFEAECLMLMSRAYVGEYNDTSGKPASSAPHESERDTESRRKKVAASLRRGFGAMAQKG